MIVSHTHRLIFIHAPKTGGTSLATVLEKHLTDGDITIGDTPLAHLWRKRFRDRPRQNPRIWKHSTLAQVVAWLGADRLAGYRAFTLVRNPWDRAVSFYHWAKAQDWQHPMVEAAKTLSFEGFLKHPAGGQQIFRQPYTSWLAGTGMEGHFMKLEEIDVASHLTGLALGPIPQINASAARDHRGHYTPETAALVGTLAAGDIAPFGYRFEDESQSG